MQDFYLDLQLFAEGDVEGTPETGFTAEDTKPASAAELLNGPEAFVIDEDGNFKWLTGKEAEEVINPSSNAAADDEDEEEDAEPSEVTPKEQPKEDSDGDNNISNGTYKIKVDGEEIEVSLDEALRGYIRQAKFTKEMQRLAEERKQLEAGRQPTNPPAHTPVRETYFHQDGELPPIETVDFSDFRQANDYITQRAVLEAKQKLQVEELLEVDFAHQSAFLQARERIANEINGTIERNVRLNQLEAELRSEEPQFDEVYKFAMEQQDKMSYGQVRAINDAFAQGKTEEIRKFFTDMRKEYYAAITQVPTKPKVVKVAKGGEKDALAESQKPKQANAKDLRNMSSDEQRKWLLENIGVI